MKLDDSAKPTHAEREFFIDNLLVVNSILVSSGAFSAESTPFTVIATAAVTTSPYRESVLY